MALVLFKENISQYFILVAIFYGMADSLYWATHDVMNIEIVDNKNRKKYMTTKRILSKLIHIVIPVALGTSIELTSFTNIAIYIFVLTIVQILASLFINTNKIEYAKKLLVYCASFIVIGLLGLLMNIDRTTLILYNFIYSITVHILEVMFKIKTDNIVKEYSIEDWIIEHHTLLDIFQVY